MIEIVIVLVVVFTSLIVTRVATIALTLTGLSRESARFQARSALTGVGFTTSEAESVVEHPVRRRIVMTLMLIGSAGIVTVIASLSVGFAKAERAAQTRNLAILVVGLALLLFLFSRPRVDRVVQRLIRRLLLRYTDIDVRDYAALLQIHGDYAVSELQIEDSDWLAGHTLGELRLNHEGVLVLAVQRGHEYLGAPTGETRVRAGDVLLIYGRTQRLEDLDRRPSGPTGELAHATAVGEQRAVEQEQRRLETEEEDEARPDGTAP